MAFVFGADYFALGVRVVVLDVVVQAGHRDRAHHVVDLSAVDDHHEVLDEPVFVPHLREGLFELPSLVVCRDSEASQHCQKL